MISHILYDINIIYIDKMIFIWYFVLGTIIMEGHMIKSFKKGFNPAERAGKGSGISAFTLAEVLITLGIIGVVAQYKTAYKKALSVLSQAVVLNVALDDYDLEQTTSTGTGKDEASVYNIFKKRMNVVNTGGNVYSAMLKAGSDNKTMKTTKEEVFGVEDNYTLYFNDGITFTFPKTAIGCTQGDDSGVAEAKCRGVIDVNGEKNPNKETACSDSSTPGNCTVLDPRDIYPVIMYNQTILPATEAGDAVLYGGK